MVTCMRIQGRGLKSLMRNWRRTWTILTFLQGENGIDLKFLEDLVVDNGINAMAIGDNMQTVEEYGNMLVDKCPNEEKEEMSKYLNMELTMGIGMDDKRWGQVMKHSRGFGREPIGHAHFNLCLICKNMMSNSWMG